MTFIYRVLGMEDVRGSARATARTALGTAERLGGKLARPCTVHFMMPGGPEPGGHYIKPEQLYELRPLAMIGNSLEHEERLFGLCASSLSGHRILLNLDQHDLVLAHTTAHEYAHARQVERGMAQSESWTPDPETDADAFAHRVIREQWGERGLATLARVFPHLTRRVAV